MAVLIFVCLLIIAAAVGGWMLRSIGAAYESIIREQQHEQEVLAEKLNAAVQKTDELTQRLTDMESGKRSRNPYLTNVGLEDGIATALDIEQTIQYANIRNQVLLRTLQQIRRDPSTYDEDRPNNKRPIGSDR